MSVYEGNEPYIFISYAHKDSPKVLPIIEALQDNGFRVWYDGGIEAGTEWPEYIANHLAACGVAILFISDNALASKNCIREINYAISEGREMLAVYLSDVKLSPGMKMQLGTIQALFRNRFIDNDSFVSALLEAKLIAHCRDGATISGSTISGDDEEEEDLSAFFDVHGGRNKIRDTDAINYTNNIPITIYKGAVSDELQAIISSNAATINLTFTQLKINALVSEVEIGPRVTTYHVHVDGTMRLNTINKAVEDLKFALGVSELRFLPPSSRNRTIRIEILNEQQDIVLLEDILKESRLRERMGFETRGDTSVCLGREANGEPVFTEIASLPHLLMGGITQTGKTTLLHSMIVSMITRVPKERLGLILVDLKGVEFDIYSEEPHMLLPVIHDSKTAAKILSELCNEMEHRYKLFMEQQTRSIEQYNDSVDEDKQLPRIIFIVDDYADLIFGYKKDIETAVMRLSQKSRAAGIHVILSTQRSDVTVSNGVLKANIPSRIAFRTLNAMDSRTILDTPDAKELGNQGDALFSPMAQTNSTRINTPYISVERIISIVKYLIKTEGKAVYNTRFALGLTGIDQIEILPESKGKYRKPSTSQLNKSSVKTAASKRETKDVANVIITTLQASFNINATVGEITTGPRFTRYEITPTRRIGAARIKEIEVFLSMYLSTSGIFTENSLGNAINFYIPNKQISPVYIRDLMEINEYADAQSSTTIPIGCDLDGTPFISDIKNFPHALVAGASGMGKSVFLNSMIASILFKADPRDVKLVLIDPKMVEFVDFAAIPHLLTPIITDVKVALSAFGWLNEEMERRYEAICSVGVLDIDGFNEAAPGKDDKMSRIVVIVDEFADFMLYDKALTEKLVVQILKKGRRVGIHLIIGTQRPSIDVLTGNIKANMPTRIAFKTASVVDSRNILDQSGAESLLGKGDMIIKDPRMLVPLRIQCAYISDEEIRKIIDGIVNRSNEDTIDELLIDVVEFVFLQGYVSTSILQRKFAIGYNRAANLIETMFNLGIIGEMEGSSPRKLLMTREEWEKLKGILENE